MPEVPPEKVRHCSAIVHEIIGVTGFRLKCEASRMTSLRVAAFVAPMPSGCAPGIKPDVEGCDQRKQCVDPDRDLDPQAPGRVIGRGAERCALEQAATARAWRRQGSGLRSRGEGAAGNTRARPPSFGRFLDGLVAKLSLSANQNVHRLRRLENSSFAERSL